MKKMNGNQKNSKTLSQIQEWQKSFISSYDLKCLRTKQGKLINVAYSEEGLV